MILKTYQYTQQKGFNSSLDGDLDSDNTAVFIFSSPGFKDDQNVFATVRQTFPRSIIVGCSGAGEIFNHHVYDDSLSVAVLRFSHTKIRLATFPIVQMNESFEIGKRVASALNAPDLTGVFLLADGLKFNGSELVSGINQVVASQVVVTGGLAGDGSNFKETWILKDGCPAPDYVSALAFYGDRVKLNHGSQGGWNIFGPERIVTKSEANILYELDGRPALSLYKEYLGEKSDGLPATGLLFPLQIRQDRHDEKRLVRTVLAVDEATQAMTFAGNIPQGSLAQLMRANFDTLIEGAATAATRVGDVHQSNLTIAISCVGRRLVLGERTDEEVEATLQHLPKETKLIGFYSYGEISPFVKGQNCELHNQTMTLTTISEDES